MRKRISCATVAVLMVVALSACSGSKQGLNGGGGMSSDSAQQTFDALMQRPTIEHVTEKYSAMQEKVRTTLEREYPSLDFVEDPDSGTVGGCGSAYPSIDRRTAQSRNLTMWVAEHSLSEKDWAGALKTVRGIVAGNGLTNFHVYKNKSADHDVVMSNQHGDQLHFSSAKNTVLAVMSGCYLTAEAKQRGSLPPEPTY